MSVFFALMAMIGMLTTAIGLSYPITYVLDHTVIRPYSWLMAQAIEWDRAYRS